MQVSFLNPADGQDALFGSMVSFMRRAAGCFDIELEVVDCHRNHEEMREKAREVVERPRPPEHLLLCNEEGLAVEALPQAAARGIKVLLLNEGLMVPDRQALGLPGEQHASWLGELIPDDRQAGYLLAKSLIDAARRTRRDRGGQIVIGALGGSFTSSSLLRINGLRQAVSEAGDVTLAEVVPANWRIERARDEAAKLLERYPEMTVLWSASDHMALGAAEAAAGAGRTPGKDIVIGGVDWAPFALEKVREGVFAASAGGHFLDGAWSLVLLYDHHNGATPAPIQEKSRLAVITRENVDLYERLHSLRDEADFSRFSKAKNPTLKKYEFSVDALV